MNQFCFADNPCVQRDQLPTIEGLVSGKQRADIPTTSRIQLQASQGGGTGKRTK